MAPKKNDDNTAKKTPKKRVVKLKPEKPKLKTPSVIKVKIPRNSFGFKLNRRPTAQQKLELANEVALAQLRKVVKTEEVTPQVVEDPKLSIAVKGKRKCEPQVKAPVQPKRQKKSVVSNEVSAGSGPEEVMETKLPKTRTRKKPVAKNPTTPQTNESKDRKSETADSPPAKKKRGRPKLNVKPIIEVVIKDEKPDLNEIVAPVEITDQRKNEPDTSLDKSTRTEEFSTVVKVVQSTPNGISTRTLRSKAGPKRFMLENKTEDVPDSAKEVTKEPDKSLTAARKGSYSSNSGHSWTHDISASSTTTCVTVTTGDFVRFDRKLPVVEVVDCFHEPRTPSPDEGRVREQEENSSSSSSSSSSTSSSSSKSIANAPRLNLSATSNSVASSPRAEELTAALASHVELFRQFEADIFELIGGAGIPASFPLPAASLDVLQYEREVIAHSRDLKRLVTGVEDSRDEFVRPAPPRARARSTADRLPSAPAVESSDQVLCDQTYDDDDALSLFAESITAIDPSRFSTSSIALHPRSSSHLEEYVPTPIAPPPLETRSYEPTRIDHLPEHRPPITPICEKQSADSTSIREMDALKVGVGSTSQRECTVSAPSVNARRIALQLRQSALFRGVCFHYLTGHCRFEKCRFSHSELSAGEIRLRCAPLNDNAFLQEVALVRSHPGALRHFALALISEMARRGLTRVLLETTAEFACVANGAKLRAALEAALMQLSVVDLQPYVETLERRAGNTTLGAAMLRALADTQNFSRFRGVFAALASHAVAHRTSVPLPIAEDILQRVCILPCEPALACAMMSILELTDAAIWGNELLKRFETQLRSLGGDVYEKFLRAQRHRLPASSSPKVSASALPALAPPPDLLVAEREEYTSPDTTHFDRLNNVLIEPIITRTVNFERSQANTTLVTYNPNVPPPNHQGPPKTFTNWNNKSSFHQHGPLRRPNGHDKTPNGPDNSPNRSDRSGRTPNVHGSMSLGPRTPNGPVRTPNGPVRIPNGPARMPNALNRLPNPSFRIPLQKQKIKRLPIPYSVHTNYQWRGGGDFYD